VGLASFDAKARQQDFDLFNDDESPQDQHGESSPVNKHRRAGQKLAIDNELPIHIGPFHE